MKKKLITLLMVVALVAGMTTLLASAATIDLGNFTWFEDVDGSPYPVGWHTVESAKASGGGATSNGLTTAQLTKATHLVLEVSEVPEYAFVIYWESNVGGEEPYRCFTFFFATNPESVPPGGKSIVGFDSILDGNTLTIPLSDYLEGYSLFSSIADEYADFVDGDGNGAFARIGADITSSELGANEWIVSARLIVPDEETPPPTSRPSNNNDRDSVPPTGDATLEQSALTSWLLIGTFAVAGAGVATVVGIRKSKKSPGK